MATIGPDADRASRFSCRCSYTGASTGAKSTIPNGTSGRRVNWGRTSTRRWSYCPPITRAIPYCCVTGPTTSTAAASRQGSRRGAGPLEAEGLLEETLVLFTTDHGISHARGKQFLYDEGIHVPLIVRGPGIGKGIVRDDPVELIDLAAISLAAAGVGVPAWMQGRDVFAPGYVGRDAVFAARDRCDETMERIRSVRTTRFKYIRNSHPSGRTCNRAPTKTRSPSCKHFGIARGGDASRAFGKAALRRNSAHRRVVRPARRSIRDEESRRRSGPCGNAGGAAPPVVGMGIAHRRSWRVAEPMEMYDSDMAEYLKGNPVCRSRTPKSCGGTSRSTRSGRRRGVETGVVGFGRRAGFLGAGLLSFCGRGQAPQELFDRRFRRCLSRVEIDPLRGGVAMRAAEHWRGRRRPVHHQEANENATASNAKNDAAARPAQVTPRANSPSSRGDQRNRLATNIGAECGPCNVA